MATGKSPKSRTAGLESLRYVIVGNALITGLDGPHSSGGGEGSRADGILNGKGLNVTIAKEVVEPVVMRFVQYQSLINAAWVGWILRRGSRVNLVKVAVGAAIL